MPTRSGIQRLPRSQAIDGLRALAALAVVGYHATPRLIPGGWMGVNVFFVLSGFLITHLLLVEIAGKGRIDLKKFWLRRARRLLPPVTAVLLVYLAAVVVIRVVLGRGDLGASFLTALLSQLYVANWIVALRGNFDGAIGHLWSLSVEEQFYLVWPLVLAVLATNRFRRMVPVVMGAAIVIGACAPFYVGTDTWRLYFGTEMHVAELMIGAVLAYAHVNGWFRSFQWDSRGLRTTATVAFALIVVALFVLPFLGWFFFLPPVFVLFALCSAVVIANLAFDNEGPLAGLLSTPWLAALGLRSYALYIAHHPIEVGLSELPTADNMFLHLLLTLGLSLIAAELVYRLVELRWMSSSPKQPELDPASVAASV